jgi:exopolysaccharide biosynthesis WecB/TagA/CpsF family protein
VDFLVQARRDAELRRVLLDAHLVLCDGTPLVWASRLLGRPLPERVAGSDLVPELVRLAAKKNYRLFFLGATLEAGIRALANLHAQFPDLQISHYSPPFRPLPEMDHHEIREIIRAAQPDLLFVAFGCPKAEKWMAMNYQLLGVPVIMGVGGTIDFLAGRVKRAPCWMQRAGLEWFFRLSREPRRLFRRYAADLWFFGWAMAAQLWRMKIRSRRGWPRKQAA